MSTPRLSLLFTCLYLIAHVWLFWMKPPRYLEIEIALQLLLLAAVYAVFRRRQTGQDELFRIPRWLIVAGVLIFLAGGLAANRIVTAGRLISDESAYRFQSRIFASGHFTAPAPPAGVFFEHHIITGGRWFTKFPPGWPLVLAASSLAGLSSAVNILLGVITLGIVFLIGRRIYSETEALVTLFFLILSPLFFGNCLGQMSHPLCGALLSTAALFYFRARQAPALWNVCVMLGAVVLAISVRPLTGALFGLVLGTSLIWEARGNRRRLTAMVALCGLFAAAAVCLSGAYNYETTGAFTKFPYAEFSRTAIPVELIPDAATATRALRWGLVSTWAFTFPLLFPAAAFTVFCDREKRGEAIVLAALFLLLVAGYAPNRYTSGSFLGERFYFEGFFAVPLLAARAVTLLQRNRGVGQLIMRCTGPLAASAVATLALSLPAVFREVRPYSQVRALAETLRLHNATVFLKSQDPEFIAKHYNLNQANWPAASVFFAPDPGADERQAMADALGRPDWAVISYDSASGTARLEHK